MIWNEIIPVAPVPPVAPVLPVAPVPPVAPVLPVAPVPPVAPVLPVAPVPPKKQKQSGCESFLEIDILESIIHAVDRSFIVANFAAQLAV